MKSSRIGRGTGTEFIVGAVVCLLSMGCGARMRPQQPSEQAWCNRTVSTAASVGQMPPTESIGAQASCASQAEGGEWIVVWASWCEPCRQELPRIGAALELLKRRGIAVKLTLVSIDTSPEALADFLRKQPSGGVHPACVVRVLSPDSLDAWARTVGLASSSSGLPFHLLASPAGSIVCMHAGELFDEDVRAIPSLLARLATASSP